MKLYQTPGGTWAGSEKDWKTAMKAEGSDPKAATLKTIEVPTSKAELMEFLTFHNVNCIAPRSSSAVAPQEQKAPLTPAPAADTTVPGDLDALFAAAPLRKQLTLAVLAIDAADAAIHA